MQKESGTPFSRARIEESVEPFAMLEMLCKVIYSFRFVKNHAGITRLKLHSRLLGTVPVQERRVVE